MQEDFDAILNAVKNLLKEELTEISFNTWIKDLKIKNIEDTNIVLTFRDAFNIPFILSKYGSLIRNGFNIVLHKYCTIDIICEDEIDNNVNKNNNPHPSVKSVDNNSSYVNSALNSKYTFSNFIVGPNNKLAHAASLAVAEAPSTAYNPLFLYGEVGLGKTHLMHAIGNEVLQRNPNTNVLYVSSEKFTNEFVNSIKDYSNEKFRNKYRNIDMLLIDDIQFISGKEGTQEEFFHTFNALYENGKQIIISSDKTPQDIPLLEARLKSRFNWGLTVDISMADYETRLAILKKKTDETKVIISDSILENIAEKINSNIRELEGVFNKLIANSTLTHTDITIEMSERAINDMIHQTSKSLSLNYVLEVVSNYFGISTEDIKSSKKSNDIAVPRQICMYLSRAILDESFPAIGKFLGGKDHSTVMYAYKKIQNDMENDVNLKQVITSIKNLITSN